MNIKETLEDNRKLSILQFLTTHLIADYKIKQKIYIISTNNKLINLCTFRLVQS